MDTNPTPTKETKLHPNQSKCEHCGELITWCEDSYCYAHNDTGFADCYLRFSGGDRKGAILINPKLSVIPPEGKKRTRAEPVTWFKGPSGKREKKAEILRIEERVRKMMKKVIVKTHT